MGHSSMRGLSQGVAVRKAYCGQAPLGAKPHRRRSHNCQSPEGKLRTFTVNMVKTPWLVCNWLVC